MCKFYTNWKLQPSYTATVNIALSDGAKTSSIIKTEDASKLSVTQTGQTSYQIIQIDNALYTKADDGTWWKQTLPAPDIDKYKDQSVATLKDPILTDKITYKKVGKEKCGTSTCLKYQVADPADAGKTAYVWFNDQSYKLQRLQVASGANTWDATYDYAKVSVTVPSTVKDLQAGQYLVPGQGQPTSLPATGDTGETMDEYLRRHPDL